MDMLKENMRLVSNFSKEVIRLGEKLIMAKPIVSSKKIEFKSQVCTTREQSELLLALGLKKETADMTWEFSHTKNGEPQYDCRAESSWDSETFARYVEYCEKLGYFEHWKHEDGSQMTPEEVYDEIMKIHIPAWSLHRLIEMMPKSLHFDEYADTRYYLTINPYKVIYCDAYSKWVYLCDCGSLYDKIISCIEWLIKKGYFPKEYLV